MALNIYQPTSPDYNLVKLRPISLWQAHCLPDDVIGGIELALTAPIVQDEPVEIDNENQLARINNLGRNCIK